MFCPKCGAKNDDNVYHCAFCGESVSNAQQFGASAPPPPPGPPPTGQPVHGGHLPPKPSNWLIPAILCTVLCCLPLGIISIVFAVQVDSKYNEGDFAGAQSAASKAKLFALIGILSTVICGGAYFIFVIVMAAAGGAGGF